MDSVVVTTTVQKSWPPKTVHRSTIVAHHSQVKFSLLLRFSRSLLASPAIKLTYFLKHSIEN